MNKIEKDIIESLYLYVEDYSLFSRNDNLVWHFKNFLDQDYSNFEHLGDNVQILHCTLNSGKFLGISTINTDETLDQIISRYKDLKSKEEKESFEGHYSTLLKNNAILDKNTKISVIAKKYRIVFCLDVSPSVASYDNMTESILYDQIFMSLKKTIFSLAKGIKIPNSNHIFYPTVICTILLQGSGPSNFKVLIHGITINRFNVKMVLRSVVHKLRMAENEFVEDYKKNPPKNKAGLGYSLKNSMFSVKLLPADACPLIVLISDCVNILENDLFLYDGLIMLMNREDISCSAIQLGSGFKPYCNFGYVPNIEDVEHLTECSYGTFFDQTTLYKYCDNSDKSLGGVNLQTKLLVKKNFYNRVKVDDYTTVYTKQYNLKGINYIYILEARYREGFMVNDIQVSEEDNNLNVKVQLNLLWNLHNEIKYTLEFIHNKNISNPTPKISVFIECRSYAHIFSQSKEQLETFFSNMNRTDVFLERIVENTVHLNSIKEFSESSNSKQQIERLFWKALNQLDKEIWHRWFKTERIEIIMKPDEELQSDIIEFKRKILDESKSTKHVKFSFQMAQKEILNFFSSWTTLSGYKHSYARIISHKSPQVGENTLKNELFLSVPEFVVARLAMEERKYGGICIITLSYFDARPTTRNMISLHIKNSLRSLITRDNIHYLTVCSKPLRYIRITYNFELLKRITSEIQKNQTENSDNTLDCPYIKALSQFIPTNHLFNRHMKHVRWIWKIKNQHTLDASFEAIVKTRLRDGFKLTDRDRYYSFYKEIPICASSLESDCIYCAVQYVIFPYNGYLITELWTESNDNWVDELKKRIDIFPKLKGLIHDIDFHIISTLETFDTLASLLNPFTDRTTISYRTELISYNLSNSYLDEVYLELPPFDLFDVSRRGSKHIEIFNSFQSSDNSKLHKMLSDIISFRCECEVPNEGVYGLDQKGKCWIKSLGNTNEFLLVHLYSLERENQVSKNNLSLGASQGEEIKIAVYQCTREIEPPQGPTTELRSILDPNYVDNSIPHKRESRYPPIIQFCEFLKNEYRIGYAQVVYANLIEGAKLEEEEFRLTSEVLQEYTTEIDITQFFRILFKRKGDLKESETVEFDPSVEYNVEEEFEKAYEKYFKKVKGYEYQHFYFYHPQANKDIDSEEEGYDELIFSTQEKDSQSQKYIWATEQRDDTKLNLIHDFASIEPLFMKSECIFLSKQDSDSPLTLSFSKNDPSSKAIQVWTIPSPKSNPELSGLSFSKIILRFSFYSLLPSIISPSASPLDRHSSPRTGVLDIATSPVKQTIDFLPDSLRGIVNNFLKSVNSVISIQILEMLRYKSVITAPILTLIIYHLDQLSYPYIYEFSIPLMFVNDNQGLSIFIQQMKEDKDIFFMHVEKNTFLVSKIDDDNDEEAISNQFWMVLDVQCDKVEAIIQSKLIDDDRRDEIIQKIKSKIRKLCERSNQITLLIELNETRKCNDLLEAQTVEKSVNDKPGSDKLTRLSTFKPGQFACPCVFETRIYFHDRLDIIKAINVANDAFHQFSIENRKFMYVYMDQNKDIYYLTIKAPENQLDSKSLHEKCLLLNIYGVCKPDENLTTQLVTLVESKLTDFTVKVFSNLLRRYSLMKFTDEDKAFLCPPNNPQKIYSFQLPEYIDNILIFQAILENNFVKQHLTLLNLSDNMIETNLPQHSEDNKSRAPKLFLYNQMTTEKNYTKIHSDFGDGIACIQTEFLGNISDSNMEYDNIFGDFAEVQPAEINSQEENMLSSLTMKVWTRGSVKINQLMEYITKIVNQSIIEYLFDIHIYSSIKTLKDDLKVMTCIYNLIEQGISLGSINIKKFTSTVALQSWAINHLFTDFVEIFADINIDFKTCLYFFQNDSYGNIKLELIEMKDFRSKSFNLPKKNQYSSSSIDYSLIITRDNLKSMSSHGSINASADNLSMDIPNSPDSAQTIKVTRNVKPLQNDFALMRIKCNSISIYTFNWSSKNQENLEKMIIRLLNWIDLRQHLLGNIIHQKMGLFYHLPPLKETHVQSHSQQKTSQERFPKELRRSGGQQPKDVNPIKFTVDTIDLLSENSSPLRTKTKTKRKKKGSDANCTQIGDIQIDYLLKNLTPITMISHKDDPVRRHASHFKHISDKYLNKHDLQQSLRHVYQQWSRPMRRERSSSLENNLVTSQDINAVIRSSRLIHCCRVPYYLPELFEKENIIKIIGNDNNQSNESNASEDITSINALMKILSLPEQKLKLDEPHFPEGKRNENSQKWRTRLLTRFLDEYVKYLETFGVYNVVLKDKSRRRSNKKKDVRYMQKVFRGGLLFIEIGYKSYFVTCNLYCMFFNVAENDISSSDMATSKDKKNFLYFIRECEKLKSQLHFDSFLYDFLIREMNRFIEYGSANNLPSDEFVKMLQAISLYYTSPPNHARNIIQSSNLIAQLKNTKLSALELFTFIGNNASKYGFFSTGERGITPGIFNIQKEQSNGSDDNIYSVVAFISDPTDEQTSQFYNNIYQSAKKKLLNQHLIDDKTIVRNLGISENKFIISYFVLRSSKNAVFPLSYSPSSAIGDISNLSEDDVQIKKHKQQNISIDNYISSAGKIILKAVNQAIAHSERDLLWNQIVHEGIPNSPTILLERFLYLLNHIERIPLYELDPMLKEISSLKVNWKLFFDYLSTLSGINHTIIDIESIRHVLIFNNAEYDFMIHFILPAKGKIEIYFVRRESNSSNEKVIIEKKSVSKLINILCHWLWKQMILQLKK